MQVKLIRRKCDFCGDTKEFNEGNMTVEQSREMSNWTTLVREYIVDGQAMPVMKHACKDSCAANLLSTGALVLPPEFLASQRRH